MVKRKGFAGALAFVNQVGELAEAADHHPDIDIRWDTVTLRLSTHSAGGLTENDLALAGQIDAIGLTYSSRPSRSECTSAGRDPDRDDVVLDRAVRLSQRTRRAR